MAVLTVPVPTVARTSPYVVQQASVSSLPWDVDLSTLLAGGESVSAPTATLENLATGAAYPAGVLSAAVLSSTTVRVTLTALAKGARYRLATQATAATNKTPAVETIVEVPF